MYDRGLIRPIPDGPGLTAEGQTLHPPKDMSGDAQGLGPRTHAYFPKSFDDAEKSDCVPEVTTALQGQGYSVVAGIRGSLSPANCKLC